MFIFTAQFHVVKRENGKVTLKHEDGEEITMSEKLFDKYSFKTKEDNHLCMEDLNDFISSEKEVTVGAKTAFLMETCKNGFALCSTSSCIDPKNYSSAIGLKVNKERNRNKLFELLGFLVQTAHYGTKAE